MLTLETIYILCLLQNMHLGYIQISVVYFSGLRAHGYQLDYVIYFMGVGGAKILI